MTIESHVVCKATKVLLYLFRGREKQRRSMMPFSSNFEALPDEILLIILQYSGNAYTVFRTFSGLNQRLNNILVDRRLHLLTDFLYMSA